MRNMGPWPITARPSLIRLLIAGLGISNWVQYWLFKMGDFHLFAHRKMTGRNKKKTRNEHERFQTWLNVTFKSDFLKLGIKFFLSQIKKMYPLTKEEPNRLSPDPRSGAFPFRLHGQNNFILRLLWMFLNCSFSTRVVCSDRKWLSFLNEITV